MNIGGLHRSARVSHLPAGLISCPIPADEWAEMLISLRKYLDRGPEQLATALLRVVRLLLDTIETHAVKGDAGDHEKFRAEIRGVRETLATTPAVSEAIALGGRAAKALEQYNARTGRFVQRQCAELQTMIAMLTNAMTAIASGSQHSVMRLQEIERQLQSASVIEDLQTAKACMSECLEGLRSEIGRQREESARRVAELRKTIEKSHERTAARSNREARTDPLTGLPERAAAEAALIEAVKGGRPVFAAVFAIERLDLINGRFGREVGDQVLLFFQEHVRQALSRSDRLFRWTGPALLAIVQRNEPIHKVREEMSRVVSRRLSKSVTVANRSVLLPIPSNWTIFAAHEVRPHHQLVRNIDLFLTGGAPDAKAAAV